MKRYLWIGWMIIGIVACNVAGAATSTPIPTVTPTNLPAATTAPTAIPATAAPTSAGVDRVKIYLVAMEDNGKSGDMIGCGDSIVAVERPITPTQAPLRAALEELLSITDQYYGESGLYNALYQARLTVDDITIDANGKATIHLKGTMASGGVCDDPRIIAQLTYTAKQFSTVKEAAIYVNGTLIEELLSGK